MIKSLSAKKTNSIEIEPSKAEASRARDHTLLEMLDPVAISEALAGADWGVRQEIALYTRIANDPNAGAKSQMTAAKALRQLIVDALRLSGRLATIVTRQQAQSNEDGSDSLFTVTEMKKVSGALVNTESLLKHNQGGLGARSAVSLPAPAPDPDALQEGDSDARHHHPRGSAAVDGLQAAEPQPEEGQAPLRDGPGDESPPESGPEPRGEGGPPEEAERPGPGTAPDGGDDPDDPGADPDDRLGRRPPTSDAPGLARGPR